MERRPALSKVDEILERSGMFMGESIGLRAQPAGDGRYVGVRLSRDKGEVPLEMLAPDPDQPRKEFDDIKDLAANIKQVGILQALRVRWDLALGKWKILTGERRYRAAGEAGLVTVPCILLDRELTADEVLEDQLIENLHRADLAPLEEAKAFKRLLESKGCTQAALAEELHVSKQKIGRALALLELPAELQADVGAGRLAASSAAELARVRDPQVQRELASRAMADRQSGQAIAEAVRLKVPKARQHRKVTRPLKLCYRGEAGLRMTLFVDLSHGRRVVGAWEDLAAQISRDLRQRTHRRVAA
jgi:ParB family chromosome partitioning protein